MPANKFALLRYRVIDKCLRNKYKPYPSMQELQNACRDKIFDDVSVSSIEKDLKAMRNEEELGFFAPIKYSKAKGGYYYTDPNYSIDNMPLNEEDIEALTFVARTLDQFKGAAVFQQFEFAVEKIFDRLSISQHTSTEALKSTIQFENQQSGKGSEWLGVILKAIQNAYMLEFSHQRHDAPEPTKRTLEPYLLKEYRSTWYLVGYDREKERYLTFGLDRIFDLIVTENGFTPRQDFDSNDFFEHTIGVTTGNYKPQHISLRAEPLAGKYLQNQPLHASQKLQQIEEDGWYTFSYFVNINFEFMQLILGFGAQIKVVSPPELQQELASIAQKVIEYYK